MIAPVPVPPCSHCLDPLFVFRPHMWPPSTHPVPFPELLGRTPAWAYYLDRLPAALDPSRP